MASSTPSVGRSKSWVLSATLLLGVLLVLFLPSLTPDRALFANDGPLGTLKADAVAPPSSFVGVWHDLNWLGVNAGSQVVSPSFLLLWLLGPVGFAKFYGPITLLLLGL